MTLRDWVLIEITVLLVVIAAATYKSESKKECIRQLNISTPHFQFPASENLRNEIIEDTCENN